MRVSEFWRAVDQVFGEAYGSVVTRDVVLEGLGGRSAVDALAAGVDARRVWDALCDSQDVPMDRRHGKGLAEPQD
ncbi:MULTISPECIES: DUF3046 domain-containing protein [Curtobacterium]|jgi:hypothetical protein|uniref:DUF3046 domain-containing protein n=1 Tax=Curtobacterium TaxID=2034 RepID=UPI000486BA29|nr:MULTISPECIES: DUF3046 domain-containing protein [Curtobacterium]MBT1583265.1 DUF3046 domain-containing protein [Curtobacterium flaccumfaciens pv. flaccumfaciens]MBT1606306.1 DUF3046 domain-containing protein [Curtobacterium flaccumfaciens pv. betae]MBT1631066.1 DUF3046 domain-containing protein [Curtobacterium flaccumfaciens pv. oortii]MBT1656968.1 DUF3046 domain-containing protein [Curtobacterium flaccumfaciens pv. betae]MBT1669335.1 DUF3046 domain-containing protein [Curtobacterium flaccu